MTIGSIQSIHSLKLIVGSLVLTAALLLKTFYSHADSEDLVWIIGPTAFLTETFSNLSFIHESGFGWVDVQHNVVIAPVCAGVNFLIISFCMSSFQLMWRGASLKKIIASIIIAGLGAYVLTVTANTLRITLSVALFKPNIYSEWLTPDMLHRVSGTVVYYLFLCFYSSLISCSFRNKKSARQELDSSLSTRFVLFAPLFWYLLFSLGVPFANNAFQANPDLFITHALSVCVVTTFLTLILIKAQYLLIRLRAVRNYGRTKT